MVIWTDTAISDLTGFIDTAKRNGTEETMKKYLTELTEFTYLLNDMSELGTEIKEFNIKQNIRQLIYKKHRIVYYLKDNDVYITTIIHTKRDFFSALKRALENGGNYNEET